MTLSDLLGARDDLAVAGQSAVDGALKLFGFVPDHRQGEALDAFPHCPSIAML
jgi:hypothetical protein